MCEVFVKLFEISLLLSGVKFNEYIFHIKKRPYRRFKTTYKPTALIPTLLLEESLVYSSTM